MRLQNVASADGSGSGRGRGRSRRCLWPASWVALSLHGEAGCVCPLLLRLLKTLVVTSKCRTIVCYNMHSIYTLAFNGTLNGKFHNIYTRAHTHTQTPQCTLWVWPVLSWKFNWQHAVGKVIIVFLSIAINVCRYANFALFYFMQYSFLNSLRCVLYFCFTLFSCFHLIRHQNAWETDICDARAFNKNCRERVNERERESGWISCDFWVFLVVVLANRIYRRELKWERESNSRQNSCLPVLPIHVKYALCSILFANLNFESLIFNWWLIQYFFIFNNFRLISWE